MALQKAYCMKCKSEYTFETEVGLSHECEAHIELVDVSKLAESLWPIGYVDPSIPPVRGMAARRNHPAFSTIDGDGLGDGTPQGNLRLIQ